MCPRGHHLGNSDHETSLWFAALVDLYLDGPARAMREGSVSRVVRLRQKDLAPNGRLGFLALIALVYAFTGFGVYWLLTDSRTVGRGGTVSTLGLLIWFGPLIIGGLVVWVAGDRGPFHALHEPRVTVSLADGGVSWSPSAAGPGEVVWSDLGGASRSLLRHDRTVETLFSVSGSELASLRGPFIVDGGRRTVSLPTVIVEARPDRFMSVDPGHPERGCLAKNA